MSSSGGGGGNSEAAAGAGATRKGYVDAIVPTVDPNADLPGLEVSPHCFSID